VEDSSAKQCAVATFVRPLLQRRTAIADFQIKLNLFDACGVDGNTGAISTWTQGRAILRAPGAEENTG
jgi:hypothetical protein